MALPSVCMGSLNVADLTRCHQGRREHGKRRSSSEHLTVAECTGEVGGRCEREWEKCDTLPSNGYAASHGRSSISAGRDLFLGCGLSVSHTCPCPWWFPHLSVKFFSQDDAFFG